MPDVCGIMLRKSSSPFQSFMLTLPHGYWKLHSTLIFMAGPHAEGEGGSTGVPPMRWAKGWGGFALLVWGSVLLSVDLVLLVGGNDYSQ